MRISGYFQSSILTNVRATGVTYGKLFENEQCIRFSIKKYPAADETEPRTILEALYVHIWQK